MFSPIEGASGPVKLQRVPVGPFGDPWSPGSRPTGVGNEKRQQGAAERACPFPAQARLEINKSTDSPIQSLPSKDSPVCQISPTTANLSPN